MKRIVAAVVAAFTISAAAIEPASLLIPSPLSIILAYNTYVKDQKKVYYIRVQSQAGDFESAKKQAFRQASEQVAGTVVLSETELRNSRMTRDEIITYSSGLIDEYKIIDRYDGTNYVKLTVDIWVTESVMAQRLLAKSATEQGIDGAALGTRVNSILEERQRGDAIFGAILRDYPGRAFKVKSSAPRIGMDQRRNTIITVNWEVNWDDRYFDAFYDAAQKTGRKPCVLWGCPTNKTYHIMGWQYDDAQKLLLVRDWVTQAKTTITVEFQNNQGKLIKKSCNILPDFWKLFLDKGDSIHLNTKNPVGYSQQFNFGQDAHALGQLANVEVKIVKQSECQPYNNE